MYKVLICDDEKWVRRGLTGTIDWTALGIDTVLEARNGKEALTIARRERPNLIITDIKMPILSGLQMVEALKEDFDPHNVIILTGFRDFELAQQALLLGVRDYVLKPVENAVLEDKVRAFIRETEQKKKSDESFFPQYECFSQAVKNNDFSHCRNFFHNAGFDTDHVSAVILHMNSQIQFTQLRFKAESLFQDVHFAGMALSSSQLLLALFGLQSAESLLKKLLSYMPDSFAGLSEPMPLLQFAEARRLALNASRLRLLYPQRNLFHTKELSGRADVLCGLNAHAFINMAASSTDPRQVCHKLEQLLESQKETLNPTGLVSMLHTAVYKMVEDNLVSHGDIEPLSRLCNGVVDLTSLNRLVHELSNKIITSNPYSVYVQKALRFIEENYANPITLENMSELVHLNSSYFSKTFADYVGEGFSKYLSRYRIEKAKEMLISSDILVTEIGPMVGFSDYTAFTRKFKQLTGVSPSDYRNGRRK